MTKLQLVKAIYGGKKDLSGADLTGADLSGASLRRADLRDASLIGASVTGADLSGAYWDSDFDPPRGWVVKSRGGASWLVKG